MGEFKNGRVIEQVSTVTTTGGTTTLLKDSPQNFRFNGTLAQNLKLPDATTCKNGTVFRIKNDATNTITVQYDDATTLTTMDADTPLTVVLFDNGTTNGVWGIFTGGGGFGVLPNDTYFQARDFANVNDYDIFKLNTSDELVFGQDILPDTAGYGALNLGSSTDPWTNVNAKQINDYTNNRATIDLLTGQLWDLTGTYWHIDWVARIMQNAAGEEVLYWSNAVRIRRHGLEIEGDTTNAQPVKFFDKDYTNYVAVKSPDTLSGTYDFVLPDSDGNADDVLTSNGSGVTSWQPAPSGSKNYFSSSVAKGDSLGTITGYDDTTSSTLPTDGTGGTPTNFTLAVSASSPLSGTSSFVLTKNGTTNTRGKGHAIDFTIDPSDRGQVLRFSMNYGVSSGTYNDDDVIIYFRDVTNSQNIEPVPYKIKKHTMTSDRFYCEVQVPYNCATLRLMIHCMTSGTNNFDLKFDDLSFGPQQRAFGAVTTDWQSYTPIWTNGTVGNGTLEGRWRRVGSNVEIQIGLNSGTTTSYGAGIWSWSLPSGLVIDLAKLHPIQYTSTLGVASAFISVSANSYDGIVQWLTSTSVYVVATDGLSSAAWQNTIPASWVAATANQKYSLTFSAPIVGWGATATLGQDADTRVCVAAMGSGTTNQTINNATNTIIDWDTSIYDTHGMVDLANNRFNIVISGWYKTTGYLAADVFTPTTNGGGVTMYMKIDGTTNYEMGTLQYSNAYATSLELRGNSRPIYLRAGQYVEMNVYQTTGGSFTTFQDTSSYRTHFAIERVSGPAQVMAGEKTVAVYRLAATSLPNLTFTILNMSTKVIDTHGAVTTGASARFTAQKKDFYVISAAVTFEPSGGAWTTGNQLQINVYKNGSDYHILQLTQANASGSYSIGLTGSTVVELNAGEYIDVRAWQNSGVTQSVRTGTQSHISISSVGGT